MADVNGNFPLLRLSYENNCLQNATVQWRIDCTSRLANQLSHWIMLSAGSLCVIVLQSREEKSSVNNFDVPRLRFILTLIVDRLLAVCKSIIFWAVRSKSFLTCVFLFCFYFSDTDSDYQVLVQKVNDWCNEVSDWKTLGSDIYILLLKSPLILWIHPWFLRSEMVKHMMVMKTSNCQMVRSTRYIPEDWLTAQQR